MPLTSEGWYGIQEGIGSTTSGDGTRNRNPALSRRMIQIAQGLNHVAACGRVVFSTAFTALGASPNVAAETVVWRFRYDQRNPNGQLLRVLVTFAPLDDTVAAAGTVGTLRVRDETAAVNYDVITTEARLPPASIVWPQELLTDEGSIVVAPDNTIHEYTIRVINGFRLMSICIWEMKSVIKRGEPAILSGADLYVEPRSFFARTPIESDGAAADDIVRLRTVSDRMYHDNRDVRSWCYLDPGYLSVGSTTFTNIVDASLAWTPNTWGQPIGSYLGGYGLRTQVELTCWVYAEATQAVPRIGRVRFDSSIGNAETGNIVALGWYAATTKCPVATGTDDKVDVLARLTTGPGADTINVYAYGIDIDPD